MYSTENGYNAYLIHNQYITLNSIKYSILSAVDSYFPHLLYIFFTYLFEFS